MGKLLMKFVGITLTLKPRRLALLISSLDNAQDIRVEWHRVATTYTITRAVSRIFHLADGNDSRNGII